MQPGPLRARRGGTGRSGRRALRPHETPHPACRAFRPGFPVLRLPAWRLGGWRDLPLDRRPGGDALQQPAPAPGGADPRAGRGDPPRPGRGPRTAGGGTRGAARVRAPGARRAEGAGRGAGTAGAPPSRGGRAPSRGGAAARGTGPPPAGGLRPGMVPAPRDLRGVRLLLRPRPADRHPRPDTPSRRVPRLVPRKQQHLLPRPPETAATPTGKAPRKGAADEVLKPPPKAPRATRPPAAEDPAAPGR